MTVSKWYTQIQISNEKKALMILLILCCLLLVSCKQETLEPLSRLYVGIYSYGQVKAQFCLEEPSPALQKLKYLFIIDHSASNKPGLTIDPDDVQNTDPDGGRRYGPLVNFVNNLIPDEHTTLSYGLINFHDSAYQPTGHTGFESDKDTFVEIAKDAWIGTGSEESPSPFSGGFTNYQDSLSLAFSLIKKDVETESILQTKPYVSVSYRIIFVSDGAPTVQASIGSTLYTQEFTADLETVINKILDLKNDFILGQFINNISINTAYYFNTTQAPQNEAITLLQQMSDAGDGLFIQFASGQQILYQQFAPPSRNVQNQLAEIFVENQNMIWWDDGRFMLDSDGDGLPDKIEDEIGSNPDQMDSDGNGVKDIVEYRTKGRACDHNECLFENRDPYAICAGFNPQIDSHNRVTFSSTANDGLNDCEKFLLRANSQSFNSNQNLIPDFMAFKNTLSLQSGNSDTAFIDPYGDGLTNYEKLKLGLPIQISQKQLLGFRTRSTQLVVKGSTSNGTTCYQLEVDNVALSGPDNIIKIYIIQNSSSVVNKPFLKVASKRMNSRLISSFTQEDFN